MTQQQKLEKLIQKAIDGGYDKILGESALGLLPEVFASDEHTRSHFIRGLVLDPEFAKALWRGRVFSKYPGMEIGYEREQQAWQYHLQQMVIADDPINYMYEQVFGNE